MADEEFCPLCDVRLDLHDGPDSCGLADRRASMLELVAKAENSARREWGY